MPVEAPHRPVVIYDGECPLCRRAVEWLRERQIEDIDYLPCQAPGRAIRFPAIEESMCLEAMWLVVPDGRQFAGADALPHILARLRRWRALAPALCLPGIRALTPFIYRWIARRRLRISALLLKKPPDACRPASACRD